MKIKLSALGHQCLITYQSRAWFISVVYRDVTSRRRNRNYLQVIKTFSMREGWWYIGIKGDGGVKSKGTRLLIEKEK